MGRTACTEPQCLYKGAWGFQQELLTKLGLFIYFKVGRVVGIATGYGLDGPGIEFW